MVSCAVIDLNDLKGVNDVYGHAIGDIFIKEMAIVLKEKFKNYIGIYRMGGDEFLLLDNNMNEQEIEKSLKDIQEDALDKPYYNELKLSFSYGVSTYDSNKHENLEALLKDADKKMYQSKAFYYQNIGDRRNTYKNSVKKDRKDDKDVNNDEI